MVGLLTLNSRIYNYGGFLQEMALQDVIESLGYDCEIIDYDIAQEIYTFSVKRGLKNFSIGKVRKKIRDKKRNSYISNDVASAIGQRRRAFDLYRDENIKLSKKMNFEELHDSNLKYDQIVCGSDQIWNPDYNIPSFFLNFGRQDCKKIIYAASIGRSSLTYREKEVYSNLLKFPDAISVREDSAQQLISGLTTKNVDLVLDPTLLLESNYWEKKAKESSLNYKKYIFCYFLNITDKKIRCVNEFAEKNNLEIITIPYLHNEMEDYSSKLKGTLISNVNPADFLNLIKCADIVLTDSFHASVFSIVFQKEFYCFGRASGGQSMNSRIYTLLNYIAQEDKLISEEELLEKDIKGYEVYYLKRVEEKRIESLNYLSKALGKKYE